MNRGGFYRRRVAYPATITNPVPASSIAEGSGTAVNTIPPACPGEAPPGAIAAGQIVTRVEPVIVGLDIDLSAAAAAAPADARAASAPVP